MTHEYLLAEIEELVLVDVYIKFDAFLLLVLGHFVQIIKVFEEFNLIKFDQHRKFLLVHLGFHHLQVLLLLLDVFDLIKHVLIELVGVLLFQSEILLEDVELALLFVEIEEGLVMCISGRQVLHVHHFHI